MINKHKIKSDHLCSGESIVVMVYSFWEPKGALGLPVLYYANSPLQSKGNFMRFVHCSFSSKDNTWLYANFPLQNRYHNVFPGA